MKVGEAKRIEDVSEHTSMSFSQAHQLDYKRMNSHAKQFNFKLVHVHLFSDVQTSMCSSIEHFSIHSNELIESNDQRKFFSFQGSPLSINVMDMERILVIGKGLGSIPIHISTSFTILTQHALNKDLKCSIKGNERFFFEIIRCCFAGPDDRLISCILTKTDSNRYDVTYTPDRVGSFERRFGFLLHR